jgi:hypothetical protein
MCKARPKAVSRAKPGPNGLVTALARLKNVKAVRPRLSSYQMNQAINNVHWHHDASNDRQQQQGLETTCLEPLVFF